MLVWSPLTLPVKRYSVLAVVLASNCSCVLFYSRLMTRQFSLIRKCFLVTRLVVWMRRTLLKGSLKVNFPSELCSPGLTASLSGRRASRKRTISKERRPSLLFEDQMATYFYVEMAECYSPPTKSKAKLPSQVSVSPDCASQESPASAPWSLSTDKTAFIMRVPNESIIRLFSLLVNIMSPPVSHISPGRTEFDYLGNEIHHWLSLQSKSQVPLARAGKQNQKKASLT